MLVTFLLTVLVDLTVAIQVGMVLAAFLFVRRMADITNISPVVAELDDDDAEDEYETDLAGIRRSEIPPGVAVYEITGPFFFGAAAHFKETFGQVAPRPRVLILRMRHVPIMDATGLTLLSDLVRRSRKEGTRVILSEVPPFPSGAIRRSALWDELGVDNFCPSFDLAVATARGHVGRHSAEYSVPVTPSQDGPSGTGSGAGAPPT
jgi:SulP family sulfate permease